MTRNHAVTPAGDCFGPALQTRNKVSPSAAGLGREVDQGRGRGRTIRSVRPFPYPYPSHKRTGISCAMLAVSSSADRGMVPGFLAPQFLQQSKAMPQAGRHEGGGPALAPASGGEGNRALVTACIILATLMQSLDSTIANVALPYMQGTMSASQDQINWVLTSYIVAAAIMTAPVGFLAARFGRTRLFVDLRGRLHARVRAVRHGAVAEPDRVVPHHPGRFRRRADAAVPGRAVRYLSGGASRLRHGDSGAWGSWWGRSWAPRWAAG